VRWDRILARHKGSSVTLQDSTIASTTRGEIYTVGTGVGAMASATVKATGLAVDLVTQGADCATPPDGFEDESISSAELCPTYDYATCGDEFSLYLTLEEPESGYGAEFMRPGLPGPSALRLPTLPVSLPLAFDPLPLLPPAPRLEPLKLRLQPLRHEPAPPVPLAAPGEH